MVALLCQHVQPSHNSQDFFTLKPIFSLPDCMICTKEYGFAKPNELLTMNFPMRHQQKKSCRTNVRQLFCCVVTLSAGYCQLGEHAFKLRVVAIVGYRQNFGQIHSEYAQE